MLATAARLVLALVVGILATPLGVDAQQAGRIYRIGVLSAGSGGTGPLGEALREGLRELGWVEGQKVAFDYRRAEGRYDRLPGLAAELVRLKVDVIVATSASAAVAAKNATATIPIVMIGSADPVGMGLIASLARPGGNLTGLSFSVGTEVFGKELELLKQAVPKLRRVAVLWNPASPNASLALDNVKAAAGVLGVQVELFAVRDPGQFDDAFAAMDRVRVDALLVAAETMINIHRARVVALAARHRLPAIYGGREYVDAGGLMSYGPNLADMFRRSSTFVDKILKGSKPADLPVEQPTQFELAVNQQTARALGLTIPRSILAQADHIID